MADHRKMNHSKELRLNEIRRMLSEKERMKVTDLAEALNVTPETIRHDLNTLEEMNLVRREHGYVVNVSSLMELPLIMRGKEHVEEKRRAAMRAMKEVQDGMVLFIDAGSTVLSGLSFLAGRKDLTIVTNGISLAYQTARMNMKTILCGGEVLNIGLRTVGTDVIRTLSRFNFDLSLLGTNGIKGSPGFTTLNYSEVEVLYTAVQHSARRIIITDPSKFDEKAGCSFCTYSDIELLVTNTLTPQQRREVEGVHEIIEV